jgi:hypothetical protein
MKKIIRLTESDLTRIVRRVINEAQTEQQVMSMIERSGCFNTKDYPNLWKLTRGSGESIAGLIMMAGSVFGTLATPVAILVGAQGVSTTAVAINRLVGTEYDQVLDELIDFLECVGIIDENQKTPENKQKLAKKLKSQR